ncbi:Erythronate-4-phosphate dehydrogenase family protein [Rhynchospora pubera]|uniref:Erythronate-4-phosphate dehydrogenase family protein n=1 Tax=Rhynchospora pubera TaxID=906938 RepID=A0AAV8FZJ8_9POAL|nr:Erythronate-4-phosphate dehydrogenase family protein [Rhynchospora pubera]
MGSTGSVGPDDNFKMGPILNHSLPTQPPFFDLKVFYLRLTNYYQSSHQSTLNRLTVNLIPVHPLTITKANSRSESDSGSGLVCVSCSLRQDRVDNTSHECTYICTDSIRINGGIQFEVLNGEELLLAGTLDPCDAGNRWVMTCRAESGFRKLESNDALPTAELYIAGCHEGIPVILMESLDLGVAKNMPTFGTQALSGYRCYKPEDDAEFDYRSYNKAEFTDCEEEGELSWFNAGVKVGVGIGLGIFLGLGIGVGVLVQSYQSTARSFKRQLF